MRYPNSYCNQMPVPVSSTEDAAESVAIPETCTQQWICCLTAYHMHLPVNGDCESSAN